MPRYVTFPLGEYGRLGNQMFQFVSTLALAAQHRLPVLFRAWGAQSSFEVEPSLFDATACLDDAIDARELAPGDLNPRAVRWLQDPALWKNDRAWAIDTLRPARAVTMEVADLLAAVGVSPSRSTVLHVRRGDYLNYPKYFPVASENFYLSALSTYAAVGTTVIVSEDADWCTEVLMPQLPGSIILPPAPPIVHMIAMSRFDRIVIANSTFSWWSAYLNPTAEVTYPTPWIRRPRYDGSQLTLKEWRSLPL